MRQNEMLYRNFVTFIACVIAVADYCVCLQNSSFYNVGNKHFSKITFTTNTRKKPGDIQELNEQYYYWNHTEKYYKFVRTEETKEIIEWELSQYLNVSKYPGELCNRACIKGEHRICYFKFTMEFYQAMGAACGKCKDGVEKDCRHPQFIVADGVEKGVMSINRQIPGPQIHVCKHDWVVVDVENRADGSAAALHWHGLHMVDTPFMDGVPFVTQCPIHYANTFRYQYNATQPGTQFYHSHSGHHKTNGQYGVLIIRQPEEDEPYSILYDYDLLEHHVFIADWMHTYAENSFPGLPSTGVSPDSVLINGRGVFTNPTTFERSKVKPTIYYVTSGKRYLFRLVDASGHSCPYKLQIESHDFLIVASDSFAVIPRAFDTLIVNSGERYDFVLAANQTIGDYWMRITGTGSCALKPIESYALIRYIDEKFHGNNAYLESIKDSPVPPFPNYGESFPASSVLNHPNATCWDGNSSQCITELSAYEDEEELRNSKPDYKFFLAFNNYVVPNKEVFKPGKYFHFLNAGSNLTLTGAINNLSLAFPDSPPLTQPESIDKNIICNSTNIPEHCKGGRFCQCLHILKVKKDSIVELIVVDESPARNRISHPFHLHGHRFMVTDMGQHSLGLLMTVGLAKSMEKNRELRRDTLNTSPIFKDTVSIPSHGYVIVRLKATNPGFWLMHCHYEWHLSVGMGLVLQVGETSEMVKAPSDFPKCGNYVPRLKGPNF